MAYRVVGLQITTESMQHVTTEKLFISSPEIIRGFLWLLLHLYEKQLYQSTGRSDPDPTEDSGKSSF